MRAQLYAKWLAALCAAMALFGIGVMAVGYKAPTIGLVMTVVVLAGAAALLAWRARKKR